MFAVFVEERSIICKKGEWNRKGNNELCDAMERKSKDICI